MKKIIALLMAVLMTAGMLAAYSSTPAEDASPTVENTKAQAETAVVSGEKEKVTLKVWADQGELELTEKLCNEFAAEHPELIQTVVAQVDRADKAINADLDGFGKITAKLIGLPQDIAIEGVKRRQYGASFITPDVVAEQQKVADAFYELKLIPKHVQVQDIVWQVPPSK